MDNYIELNRKMWNDRVEPHLKSKLYNMEEFLSGKSSLNQIELDLLDNLENKEVLHLQCHFGQDSLSLARMGANVTGVDFSEKAIKTAEELNEALKLNARFICRDVLKIDDWLDGQFDLVFSSYGTITWLPELKKWASNIHKALKPGGKLLLVEFHPIVWMFDDDFEDVFYGYFNSGPIVEEVQGTYADRKADIKHTFAGWNHSLDEVIQPLLKSGMKLLDFQEYDQSPYDVLNDMVKTERGYMIKKLKGKIPLIYSLLMEKS